MTKKKKKKKRKSCRLAERIKRYFAICKKLTSLQRCTQTESEMMEKYIQRKHEHVYSYLTRQTLNQN
jgi:hypothetical protein